MRETATLVVAVRELGAPTATGAPESPMTALTLPLPVVADVVRWVTSPGSVQVVSTEDFSDQTLTSQDPAPATSAWGDGWLVPEASDPPTSDALMVGVSPVLR